MASDTTNVTSLIRSIDDLERTDIHSATSHLQIKAAEVRANRVPWQSYLQGQMITPEDYEIVTRLDTNPDLRNATLKEMPNQAAKTLLKLMDCIAKDQTVQYILTLIDDLLQEDKQRVELFREYSRKTKRSPWAPFLSMLNRPNGFIVNQTSRIIAKIACWGNERMDGPDLHYYLAWLRDQLKVNNNEYLQTVCRCLQMLLRIDAYRYAFLQVEGVNTLVSVLAGKQSFQIHYQLVFCLWVMTFNPDLATKISKFNVIPILADVMSETVKEKVIRIILAFFRNLLEKVEERTVIQDNSLNMVQCKVLKQLSLLESRKFADPELVENLEYLTEELQKSVHDMSSFDEYCSEVRSGRLEWSPVHRSEKFWHENAARLNDVNYELLKILIRLLESSRDPLILSVACHDIGEYVRHYPRGKNVIEQLGGKSLVMQLLLHEDPNVRYEALLAVQKIMVHNWEYLGKHLDQPSQQPKPAVPVKG